jgi:hypothetical protein
LLGRAQASGIRAAAALLLPLPLPLLLLLLLLPSLCTESVL